MRFTGLHIFNTRLAALTSSDRAMGVRRAARRAQSLIGERMAAAASRNVRRTVIICVAVIALCFAAATALQVRRDYAHALSLAQSFVSAQSVQLAETTARELDRLAAQGAAYTAAVDERSAEAVAMAGNGGRILNIALADADGKFVTAMKGPVFSAMPLREDVIERAQRANTIEGLSDPAIGSSPLTLVFRADQEVPPRFVVMPIDPLSLLPKRGLGDNALFSPLGEPLALSSGWGIAPPAYVLRSTSATSIHYVNDDEGAQSRIIALSPVPGWPLSAASSIKAADALDTWYGSLPLYLFVILGPALAGATLAFLFVREIERDGRIRARMATTEAAKQEKRGDAALLAKLAEAERRADEGVRAKTEFLAHMSHELRTPLNAIIGFAEIIATGLFGPSGHDKYTEYASDIARAGRALHARIGDILEFAHVEADRMPLRFAASDLVPLARAALARVKGAAMGRKIALAAEMPALAPAWTDEAAVARILAILLDNALRYTPESGAITLAVTTDANTAAIVLRDTGRGLTADEQKEAGIPFKRFGETDTEGGLGLSLAIAMALARRMGGALRLSGAAGQGVIAELRLPREAQ